jgi:hypothetical protein
MGESVSAQAVTKHAPLRLAGFGYRANPCGCKGALRPKILLSAARSPRLREILLLLTGAASVALILPQPTFAWGPNAQKLIVNKSIDTLPLEVRSFFENIRAVLVQHVTDPIQEEATKPAEKHNHFIYLDKYGRFPFSQLPRNYKAAAGKYGKSRLESTGLLPWQVGVYSQKLTEALKLGHWDEARIDAAILAAYVAETHDPFNTTENFDGHLTLQTGINERFGTTLIDRFSSFFPMRPTDAAFIGDPTDHAFESCLSAHAWIEIILLADRNAHLGAKSYDDEYFDRFYNQAAPTLIHQLSNAATDVGSYWLTAWTNAGRPTLPH